MDYTGHGYMHAIFQFLMHTVFFQFENSEFIYKVICAV